MTSAGYGSTIFRLPKRPSESPKGSLKTPQESGRLPVVFSLKSALLPNN
ncbi:hypothetical protein HMPREF9120_02821 [Neisseria sp. oral taxon 020 str. F0370]|nr:hypothetical protein HMPREF9120_02821 [Neisseria sp. oral taxon 020 str. F0370]